MQPLDGTTVLALEQAIAAPFCTRQLADLGARSRWANVDSPAGPIPALLPPGMPSGFEPHMGPVPALGEHTDAILREFGFSAGQVAEFHAAGMV